MLKSEMEAKGIQVKQAVKDAGIMIVETAVKYDRVIITVDPATMAPNVTGPPASLSSAAAPPRPPPPTTAATAAKQDSGRRWQIVWHNVIYFVYLHSVTLYTAFLLITFRINLYTFIFGMFVHVMAGLGITAGAHRLWAHKAYKAKWPLRLLLAFLQAAAFQYNIYEWVRDHRVHHKFTDTDADPHNSRRGFFFSHMGWLMVRKHRDVRVKGSTVDMTDLDRDWVVVWQRKLYLLLMPICCFAIPTWVPIYCWGETFWMAWNMNVLRYTLDLNIAFLVNSAAHSWGMKPYDRNISPTENISVAILAMGEGWHNYHHAFPWDYKAAELGDYSLNQTTGFLDACAKLGLAYDMKQASDELVRRHVLRTGDGSHPVSREHSHEVEVWGWGDKDMEEDEKSLVHVIHPAKQQ